jgi:hypothetical protein
MKTWLSKNWSLVLGVIVLVWGLYSVIGPWLGDGVYWVFVLWYKSIFYFVWAAWIPVLVLGAAWVFERGAVRVRAGAFVLVILSCSVTAIAAYFYVPFWYLAFFEHVASTHLDNRVYHLAFGLEDCYARFYLYDCNRWDVHCSLIDRFEPAGDYSDCPTFNPIDPSWKDAPWKEARLATSPDASMLYVLERGQVIFEYHPIPE